MPFMHGKSTVPIYYGLQGDDIYDKLVRYHTKDLQEDRHAF